MNYQADSFFLPVNAQSTRTSDACLFGVNADGIQEERTDFLCLGGEVKKIFNHADLVTTVTDDDNFTLLMFSYSASSIFDFARGSSSGEIQVDSRPSLNRANFPGRNPELKKLDAAENGSQHRAPSQTEFSDSIWCSTHRVQIHSQLSENGNQRVSGLPASGSKRV